MPAPLQGVLKPAPITAPATVTVAATTQPVSTAAVASTPGIGTVQAPMITAGPAQASTPTRFNTLILINPSDGKLVYIGQDGTVSAQTGHALYPGNTLIITGYQGPIWTLSSNGGSTLFFTST